MQQNENLKDGRYLIREQIGSGGFGAVFLAEDTRFSGNNRVAIKQIDAANERVARTSRVEADLLYNLSHPNLPKVTNCFQENGASFIVMDYISGEDLAQALVKGRKFTIDEVLRIADAVLDALEYLHTFPIYHRDVKPHNIKVDERGRIFLLDFGTAKGTLEEEKTLAFGGQSITGYTPFYAPLEQVLRVDPNSFLLLNSLDQEKLRDFAERKTDARSDIYALGATLYHLLTGFSPEQATATVRVHAVWSNKPDPLPNLLTLNREATPALANAVHRALEVMPEHRFQTAREFREALKMSQMASVPTKATEIVAAPVRFEPAPTRHAPQIIEIKPEAPPPAPVSEVHRFVPEIPPPPVEERKKLPFAALTVVLLLVLGAAGAGLVWKFALPKDETVKTDANRADAANVPANAPGGDRNAANSNGKAAPAATGGRTLEYSLTVQKMRDGRKYQEPFESSGQEIFENGYQFLMNLTPSENGFLYIFAEGLDDKNEKVFNLIFPTPKQNGGVADVTGGRKYETGWNEFGGQAGTENFWVVWSKDKPETPEKARENAFSNGGRVTDRDRLRDFLEKGKSPKTAVKDADKKLSRLELDGDSAVYLIRLEHR
ncbi:MAG: serine/threonine protein kinase [Acidobacteria bacterium]|nr:serine/threonine protein kinase [Acidobacteriota bacterium]